MDFPGSPPLPLFVHTYSRYSAVVEAVRLAGTHAVATITWPVANTAFYIPVQIPWAYPVNRVFWINGSSVTSVNMDFGIYNADGVKLYSTGSTAESGASAVQYVTPSTTFMLSPGAYYFALACSSVTASRGGQGNTTQATTAKLRLAGFLQQATALPLPADMTPASVANVCVPICGVTRTTTGF